jgi:transposase-like protein
MGKRGPKRQRHDSACPNKECKCYGKVNGENVIGHGAYKGGQRYKCNACGRTFTERTNTPLAGLRTPRYIVTMAIVMYMPGLSVASIAIVVGKQEKTVERWISRIVPHCEESVEHKLDKERHNFTPPYLQADELWTYIWSKRGKQRVLVIIDGVTKRFIAFYVGARDRISAEKLFEMMVARIRGIPLLTTTDGNETYPGMVKKFLKAVSVLPAPENTGGGKDQRGAGCTDHTVSRLLQLHPPSYEPDNG